MAPRKQAKKGSESIAEVKKVSKPGLTLGGSGTLITSGIISGEEYNSQLAGLQGIKSYEEMRNDATVNASLDVIKLPILAASWYIDPGSQDDEKYQEHADFIEQELFSCLNPTFTQFMREALAHLDYGRYPFEIVYKLRDDGLIGWDKFAPRQPKTVYYWQQDDGTPGIKQILPDGRQPSIPQEKLIIFTNRQEGDNYEGRSILRTSYRNWYMKDALYKIQGIALERQGVGIPYVKVPKGASPKDITTAEEFVKNLRANEESFLTWKPGWEFGFLDMRGHNNMDPSQAIAHHNREIVKNVLAQFLELGASTGSSNGGGGSSSGSHALSKDQSRLFALSLQYVANYMAEVITKQAIQRLIEINFGPQECYPKLCVSKIGDTDVAVFSTALKNMVDAGILTIDPQLEDFVRDTMSLPDKTEETRAENEFSGFMTNLDSQNSLIDTKQNAINQSMAYMEPEEISPEGRNPAQQASERKGFLWALFGNKKGAQQDSEQDTVMNDKIANRQRQHSMDVATARHEFDKAKMDAQIKVMQSKVSGNKLDATQYRSMQLDLLKHHASMLDKVHEANMSANTDMCAMTGSEILDVNYAHELKEQVDHAIEKLQQSLRESD